MTDQLIAGRYRLEGRLGIGGMSTVQRAYDTRLERPVAVKLLAEHLAEDETFVSRFQREALAAARLIHPNVVQVFDSGLDEASDRHFIVMELVDGQSCAELLRERGYLEPDQAVDIIAQACRGLDYAHRKGVVHRDVKPGNLLLGNDGNVKLADFGIAKATEQSSITQVGSVLGTAAYLAPEQARGEEAGPPADMYSLGVVAYQLLAGRVPYEASSLTELAYKQQNDPPAPLDSLNGEVRPSLARAVERALAIDPANRYESAAAMSEAVRGGARGVNPPEATGLSETAATRVVGGDTTAATSMLAPDPGTDEHPAARQPRQARRPTAPVTPPPARRTAEPVARRDRRGRSGFRKFVVGLLVLALVTAGVTAAIVSQASTSTREQAQKIVVDSVQQGVDDLKSFIDDHTK